MFRRAMNWVIRKKQYQLRVLTLDMINGFFIQKRFPWIHMIEDWNRNAPCPLPWDAPVRATRSHSRNSVYCLINDHINSDCINTSLDMGYILKIKNTTKPSLISIENSNELSSSKVYITFHILLQHGWMKVTKFEIDATINILVLFINLRTNATRDTSNLVLKFLQLKINNLLYLRWDPFYLANCIQSCLTKPFHWCKPLLSCPKYSRLFSSPIIWILVLCKEKNIGKILKTVTGLFYSDKWYFILYPLWICYSDKFL